MSAAESPDELLSRLEAERQPRAVVLPSCPVAITGDRSRKPPEWEMDAFWRLFVRVGGTNFHDGDCRGTDQEVRAWLAKRHPEIPRQKWPVLHELDGPWPAAGPRRNERMLIQSSARHLIHFPGNKGTRSAIQIAQRCGIQVHSVEDEVQRGRDLLEREHIDIGVWT